MMLWESMGALRHPIPPQTNVIAFESFACNSRTPFGVLFIQGDRSMITPSKPKLNPVPAILVYGTPSGPAMTQASWFRAEDKEAVKAAAEALKFSVIELHTDADRALAAGVHEGVLKGSGRMIVGSVSAEVYRRIEQHVRKGAGGSDVPKPDGAAGAPAKSASEQNMNKGHSARLATDTTDLASPPNPWEALRVGAKVLAALWDEKQEFAGFWLATVKRIENGEFTLEWFEWPEYPAFKSPAKNVAIAHPEFRMTGK
jgi:hypothetical protein